MSGRRCWGSSTTASLKTNGVVAPETSHDHWYERKRSESLTDKIAYLHGEFFDRILVWVAEIHRHGIVTVHQSDQTVDKVTDILKGSRLFSTAVDLDEAVEWSRAMHIRMILPWSVRFARLEWWNYSRHVRRSCAFAVRRYWRFEQFGLRFLPRRSSSINSALFVARSNLLCISIAHRFAHAFRLIVAWTRTEWIDIAEIGLSLRMDFGIAVHFARRSEQKPSADTSCQTFVSCTVHCFSINRAVFFYWPSMLIVPTEFTLMVFTGLYM